MVDPIEVNVNAFIDDQAEMLVLNFPQLESLVFKRLFVISALQGTTRGKHAHKNCWQLLINLEGLITLKYFNKFSKSQTELKKNGYGLLFPPLNWLEIGMENNSKLLVLATDYFDESDYIRDIETFYSELEKKDVLYRN